MSISLLQNSKFKNTYDAYRISRHLSEEYWIHNTIFHPDMQKLMDLYNEKNNLLKKWECVNGVFQYAIKEIENIQGDGLEKISDWFLDKGSYEVIGELSEIIFTKQGIEGLLKITMRMLECTKQTIVSLNSFSGDLEFLEEDTKLVDGLQYTAAAKIADFMKEKGYEEQGNQILKELEKYKSKAPLSAEN